MPPHGKLLVGMFVLALVVRTTTSYLINTFNRLIT